MVASAFIALLLGLICPFQTQTKANCLSYEPTIVKLAGKLTRETFPGPPNYASILKGDRPETVWILDLDNPVCVDEDKADPDLNSAKKEVQRLQLVFHDGAAYAKYKELVSKRVTATGTLFGGHTAHHHTDVLLTVKSLEKAE